MNYDEFDILTTGDMLIDKVTNEEFYVCARKRKLKHKVYAQVKVKSLKDEQHSRVSREYCGDYYLIKGVDIAKYTNYDDNVPSILYVLQYIPATALKCLQLREPKKEEFITIPILPLGLELRLSMNKTMLEKALDQAPLNLRTYNINNENGDIIKVSMVPLPAFDSNDHIVVSKRMDFASKKFNDLVINMADQVKEYQSFANGINVIRFSRKINQCINIIQHEQKKFTADKLNIPFPE